MIATAEVPPHWPDGLKLPELSKLNVDLAAATSSREREREASTSKLPLMQLDSPVSEVGPHASSTSLDSPPPPPLQDHKQQHHHQHHLQKYQQRQPNFPNPQHRKAQSAPLLLRPHLPIAEPSSISSSSSSAALPDHQAKRPRSHRNMPSLQDYSFSNAQRPALHPLQHASPPATPTRSSSQSQSRSHLQSQSHLPMQPHASSYLQQGGSSGNSSSSSSSSITTTHDDLVRTKAAPTLLRVRSHLTNNRVPIAPVLYAFCDRDLRLLRANEEAEELLGYGAHHLSRMDLYGMVSKSDVPVLQAISHRLFFEEMQSQRPPCSIKNIVSSVHPAFYAFAPPSMLMMAAPGAMTYSVDVFLSHANGSFAPYKLLIYRSGAFCGATSLARTSASPSSSSSPSSGFGPPLASMETQLYLAVTIVRAGFEGRIRPRKEFEMPIVIDLCQDPTVFTSQSFLKAADDANLEQGLGAHSGRPEGNAPATRRSSSQLEAKARSDPWP